NLWRDADVIGRALEAKNAAIAGNPIDKFAERCLGNGTHTDYWADRRCWEAVAAYLRAVAEKSTAALVSVWSDLAQSPLTKAEGNELREIIGRRNDLVFCAGCIMFLCLVYLGYTRHWSTWFPPICLIAMFIGFGLYRFQSQTIPMSNSTLRLGWHNVTSQQVNASGAIQRQLLARNRFGLFVEKACLLVVGAAGLVGGLAFVLWKFFTR
ncbi:MAG: hypothetical protein ABSE90_12600, partial [Verrucomicrobiota bacterium]